MRSAKLHKLVRGVLKTKARIGETTKTEASLLAWRKMERSGGPTAFGIGAAAMQMACMHIIGTEVMRQFKGGLSEHDLLVFLPTAPEGIREVLGKVHQWIAIEEGAEARRIFWQKATCEHWRANADLKEMKAQQTLAKANQSRDVVRFLEAHNLASLGSCFVSD